LSEKALTKSEQREKALSALDYALMREFDMERPEILYSEHGKPYFKDSDVKFSYSHCNYGVTCAVSKNEIGVDIERIREIKPAVIKRVCCDNELRLIKSNTDFLKIWVQKEAYAKFTGRGFAEGLKSIDTTVLQNSHVLEHREFFIGVYSNAIAATPQLVLISPP